MKNNSKQMWRSVVSLMLVFCLVFGMTTTAFATNTSYNPARFTKETVKYVSLGDSMTNGYGLEGYELDLNQDGVLDNVNGFLVEVEAAYPAQFAKWLETAGYTENVEHDNLAISAMRAEDLHFILEYGQEDAFAGDKYTQTEFVNNRFNDYGDYGINDKSGVATVAEIFQSKIADADIISMGVGNANFGVFLMGRMTNALGVLGGDSSNDSWIEIETALQECDPEVQAMARQYYNMSIEKLGEVEYLPMAMIEPLANAMTYTAISYVLNYAGSIEAIVELNPDAEIMIVGLMNTLSGLTVKYTNADGTEAYIPIGEMMDEGIGFINTYLATLPVALQLAGEYSEATFYYAEASNVEMIASTMATQYNDTVRQRVLDSTISTIFPMVKDMFTYEGFAMANHITLADVKAYEAAMKYAAENGTKAEFENDSIALSCAVFKAFETNIKANAGGTELDLVGLMALTDNEKLNGLFGEIGSKLSAITDVVTADVTERGTAAVTAWLTSYLAADDVEDENGKNSTVETRTQEYNSAVSQLMTNGMSNAEAKVTAAAGFYMKANGLNDEAALVGHFTTLFAGDAFAANLEEPLTEALDNETLNGLMNLFARMLIGNGIGCHPSAAGHETLAAAVIASYDNAYTADKAVNDKVLGYLNDIYLLLEQYGPSILNGAYDYAEQEGYIDQLEAAISELEKAIDEQYKYYNETIIPQIEAELANLNNQLAALEKALADADANVKAQIQAQIKVVEAQIAELEAALEKAEAQLKKLDKAIVEAKEAVEDFINTAVDTGKAHHEAMLEKAVKEVEEAIADVEALAGKAIAAIDTVIAKANELNEEVLALVEAAKNLPAEIDKAIKAEVDKVVAKLEAAAEGVVAQANKQLEKVQAEVAAVIETAQTAFEKAYEGYQATVEFIKTVDQTAKELQQFIQGEIEKLDANVVKQIEKQLAALETKLADLEKALKDADADLKAEIEKQIAAVEKEIAKVEKALEDVVELIKDLEATLEDVDAAVKDVISAVQNSVDDINAIIENVTAAIEVLADTFAEVEQIVGEVTKVVNEVVEGVQTISKEVAAVIETVEAVAGEVDKNVQTAIKQLQTAVEELEAAATATFEELVEQIEALANNAAAIITEAYMAAVSTQYGYDNGSYYVALGDTVASGNENYADKLAAELGFTDAQYKNLAKAGMTVTELFSIIENNAEDIQKADLITLGFGNTEYLQYATNEALGASEKNWDELVGAEGAKYVDKALLALADELKANGLPDAAIEMILDFVEAYAYAYVDLACKYPEAINAIHAINPDAQVVIVGMYNPLQDVVITVEGMEIELGEYMDAITGLANMHFLGYAMLTPNTFYVDATDVENNVDYDGLSYMQILGNIIVRTNDLYPTDAGHEYIKDQILAAINPTKIVWGDADNNGVVNSSDASLVLQYSAEVIDETGLNAAVCDVDNDGDIDSTDAMYILRYSAEDIDLFPVEK